MKERLKERFEKRSSMQTRWEEAEKKLTAAVLKSASYMEETGGEPEVAELMGELYLIDMSKETPSGRVFLCYDQEALQKRKKNPPVSSALQEASAHGLSLLTEEHYLELQRRYGPFDTKTSSWLLTDPSVRSHGGAIFGDHRFGRTFIYQNGADSYYAARGFRACVKL